MKILLPLSPSSGHSGKNSFAVEQFLWGKWSKKKSEMKMKPGLLSPCLPSAAAESQGEVEVKDPCACDSLVEFQRATVSSLEQLTHKHILSLAKLARPSQLHSQH